MMKDDHSDRPIFKDGYYIYSTGQMVYESDMIEMAQSFDNSESEAKKWTESLRK